MRWTTPLLGAAIGGGIGMLKRDPAKYALWGAGIGLAITFMGGAAVSVGSISLRVGFDSEAIGEAQMMLNQLGYNVEMDGLLGPKTTAAIKAVQARCSLPSDGKLTGDTIHCITRLANLPSGPVASGPAIVGVQSGPAIVGIQSGPAIVGAGVDDTATGFYGPYGWDYLGRSPWGYGCW